MPSCLFFFRKKALKIMLLNSGEKVNSKSLLLTVSNNNDNLHAAYVQV